MSAVQEVERPEIADPAATLPRSVNRRTKSPPSEAGRVRDIRIAINVFDHRKITRLMETLDAMAPGTYLGDRGFRCLVQLWTRAGRDHRTGEMIGMSIVDVEWEAGWRGRDCRLEHEGVLVQTLLECRLLDFVDGSYRLHDWIENQPWVAEGHRASVTGRFHKLVALARSRGCSHEEALQHAHERVPEYEQFSGRSLADDLEATAAIPEQLEISEVGGSIEALRGDKPTPRTKRKPVPLNDRIDTAIAAVPAPTGVTPELWRRYIERHAIARQLRPGVCRALAQDLGKAVANGICPSKLLNRMAAGPYFDIDVTVSCHRETLMRDGPPPQNAADPLQASPARRPQLSHRPTRPQDTGDPDMTPEHLERVRMGLSLAGLDPEPFLQARYRTQPEGEQS